MILSVCCCSVPKSYLTLCDPVDRRTPGFSVPHYLLEFAQILIHQVGDAIPPSSPSAFNISQHLGLSQGVSSLH